MMVKCTFTTRVLYQVAVYNTFGYFEILKEQTNLADTIWGLS
eukprot:COSAG02_NODE_4253_length_5584_cov_251.164995_9_plen_42_part_00